MKPNFVITVKCEKCGIEEVLERQGARVGRTVGPSVQHLRSLEDTCRLRKRISLIPWFHPSWFWAGEWGLVGIDIECSKCETVDEL